MSQYEALGGEGIAVGEARARGLEKRAEGFDARQRLMAGLGPSQAVSTYSEASMAASAMRSMAALDASGVAARSSWVRSARRRCDVLEG